MLAGANVSAALRNLLSNRTFFKHIDSGSFVYGQRFAFVANWNSNSDHPANLAFRWTSLVQ